MSADFSGLVGKVFASNYADGEVLVISAFVDRGELFVMCVDVSNPTVPPGLSGPAYVRSVEGLRLKPSAVKGDY